MRFSDSELKAIGEVQHHLRSYKRGSLTLQEVVAAVIDDIAQADAGRITPHCLALLPSTARPEVEAYVDRWTTSEDRDEMMIYFGPCRSEEQKAWLNPRYRAIAGRIVEYYRQFGDRAEPPEELAVPEVDRFWEVLRGMRSECGPTCEMEGCEEPTVRVGVFCARHHYERIEGRPAPDY